MGYGAAHVAPGACRRHGVGGRTAHRRWGPDPASRLPRPWGHGVRLLALAHTSGLLAHPKRGGGGGFELLSLPLHRQSGGGAVELGAVGGYTTPCGASADGASLPIWVRPF